mmetsp:Transcript_137316/g.237871  ORF Transcript_137316/g.237871 Transcript_137316/m.237871 type:complete len:110 (-) Transcript_137316:420-749(-)
MRHPKLWLEASHLPAPTFGRLACVATLCSPGSYHRKKKYKLSVFGPQKEVTIRSANLSSPLWQLVSEAMKNTLRRCLAVDQCERPSADELLREDCLRATAEAISSRLFK